MASPSTYLDFDLLIEPAAQGYHARVIHSPAGQAEGDFTIPFSDQDLQMLVLQVFRLSTRRSVRSIASPELREIRSFGTRLYAAVFAGPVGTCLLRSLDKARSSQAGLRVRIHLDDVPALSNVPWEFMYDAGADEFLCLSDQTPLIRYMDLAQAAVPLAVESPLRILTVISNPVGYPTLTVEKEWENLSMALQGLKDAGRVIVDRLDTPTLEALQQRLRRADFHVLHFIGHGTFDETRQDGVLLFEDAQGKGDPVGAESLGVLLYDHESMRLVVLNACEGARTSATDPFAGTAQSLVRKGIPAVIAMQFEVTDDAANTLSKEFYNALADGWPIDAALAEARKAVFTRVNAVEWATPVLYMRAPDGRIFDVRPTSTHPVIVPERIEPPPPKKEPPPSRTGDDDSGGGAPEAPWWRRYRPALIPAAVVVAGLLVWLIVSALSGSGTALVDVPQVAGLPSGEATGKLRALGFDVARVDRPSRTVPIGAVTGTAPADRAPKNGAVTMFVSSGPWIAYVTDRNDANAGACRNGCNWDIYLSKPGDPRELPLVRTSGADIWPAWSPDGSKLAFSTNGDGNYEIYVIGSDGSNMTRLTDDAGSDIFPAWSPDGKKIVFSSDRSGNMDIYVMNADGSGSPTQLTRDPGSDQGPRWSPDGTSIVFFTDREETGRSQIYLMDPNGANQRNIAPSSSEDLGAVWTPDGHLLFRRGGNVWTMDGDGAHPRQISSDETDAQPAPSPDGGQFAFRSNRSGDEDIWVVNMDGTGEQDLTNTPGSNEERPSW